MLYVIFTLAGLAFGSFLNVCIDRLPRHQSLLYPASRCDACGQPLKPKDLVPLVSYLFLKGRCRYCGGRIPWRSPAVELATGAMFVAAFAAFGLSPAFAVSALYGALFLVIMVIDAEHKLILNRITYPAAALTLVLVVLDSFVPGLALFPRLTHFIDPPVLSALAGAGVGFGFFLTVLIIYPAGLGMGDVKLGGLIGLVTGFPMVFVALFIGIMAGGLAAIYVLLFRRDKRRQPLPYGAFLGLGPIVTLFAGSAIFGWYWPF